MRSHPHPPVCIKSLKSLDQGFVDWLTVNISQQIGVLYVSIKYSISISIFSLAGVLIEKMGMVIMAVVALSDEKVSLIVLKQPFSQRCSVNKII
jgi:hypothetical protein